MGTATLEPGEMIHEVTFSLYDAMSAIELTDPKMDAVVQWRHYPRYPRSLQEAVEKRMLKLDDLSHAELIGIFDEVLACVVTWMDGHTLAQTVFTCLYLLDTKLSENLFLRAFSTAIVKIVEFIRDSIRKGGVYSEDDQQIVFVGLDMLRSLGQDVVTSSLKTAREKLAALVKEVTSSTGSSASDKSSVEETSTRALVEALLIRIRFTRSLFSVICSFGRGTREGMQSAEQELKQCTQLLDTLAGSVNLGVALDPNNPLSLGFHPLINQHLLPPSYRSYFVLSRPDAVARLKKILQQLQVVFVIGRLNSLREIHSAAFHLSGRDESPNVFVRSMVATCCITNDRGKLFGSKTVTMLLREDMRSMYNPPSLNPKSALSSSTLAQDIVDCYLSQLYMSMFELLRVYCQHHARQRSVMVKYLDTVGDIQMEAERVDQQLHSLTMKLDPQRQHLAYYSTWFLYYVSQMFINYLQLGFWYNLYSPFEFHYVVWYLEYCYGWKQTALKTAAKLLMQEPQPSGRNRKKARAKKREFPKEKEAEVAILHVKRVLLVGVMRGLEGLLLEKKIPQPSFDFGSMALTFKNRFYPFTAISTPQPLAYSDYIQMAGISNYDGHAPNLYEAAAHHFTVAKTTLESLSLHDDYYYQQLMKTLKMNLVIMNLAAQGHKRDSQMPPRLDFSVHPEFPVLRI